VPDGIELRVEPYDGPVAQSLIAAVQQEYVERYGGPDDAPVDPGEFAPPYGCFVVAYDGAEAVATGALRRAEAAHGEHEKRTGQRDENWPDWYAEYMAAEQSGKGLPQ